MATKKTGADFSPTKPNTVWVQAKYKNTGNCCLAVRKWDGHSMRPFRFGKPRELVHDLTYIVIEDEKPFPLNTDRVYQFLREESEKGNIWKQPFNMNGLPNDGYMVKISDLVAFANISDYPILDTGIGA